MINEYKVKRYGEKAAPGTINRELNLMRHAFSIAVKEWEWVKDNPVKRVSMEKEPPGRVRYLTDEEFQKLHSSCSGWLKPIVMVARHTGLRRENILSLTWKQVDTHTVTICVL